MSTTGDRPNSGGSNTNIPSDKIVKGLDGSNTLTYSDVSIDTNKDIIGARNINVTGTLTGSTKVKTNLLESINTNDDLYLDSLNGNIVMNTLLNGGVRMIGNPSNLSWIQNCSYQSGSNR